MFKFSGPRGRVARLAGDDERLMEAAFNWRVESNARPSFLSSLDRCRSHFRSGQARMPVLLLRFHHAQHVPAENLVDVAFRIAAT